MMSNISSFLLPVRVYYEDTDAGEVVYYANYLKFCERARTEWLRSRGISQALAKTEFGILLVVTQLIANYIKSARLDDELMVHTDLVEPSRSRMVFKQTIHRSAEILFTSETTIACISTETNRPTRLPPWLLLP